MAFIPFSRSGQATGFDVPLVCLSHGCVPALLRYAVRCFCTCCVKYLIIFPAECMILGAGHFVFMPESVHENFQYSGLPTMHCEREMKTKMERKRNKKVDGGS